MLMKKNILTVGKGAFLGCKELADKNGFVFWGGELYSYQGEAEVLVIPKDVKIVGQLSFQRVFKDCFCNYT